MITKSRKKLKLPTLTKVKRNMTSVRLIAKAENTLEWVAITKIPEPEKIHLCTYPLKIQVAIRIYLPTIIHPTTKANGKPITWISRKVTKTHIIRGKFHQIRESILSGWTHKLCRMIDRSLAAESQTIVQVVEISSVLTKKTQKTGKLGLVKISWAGHTQAMHLSQGRKPTRISSTIHSFSTNVKSLIHLSGAIVP